MRTGWLAALAIGVVIALVVGAQATWSWRVHHRADAVRAALDRELELLAARRVQTPLAGPDAEACNVAERLAEIRGLSYWEPIEGRGLDAIERAMRCGHTWNFRRWGDTVETIASPELACRLLAERDGETDRLERALLAARVAHALSAGTEVTYCLEDILGRVRDASAHAPRASRARAATILRALASSPPPLGGALAAALASEASTRIAMMRHLAPSPIDLERHGPRRWRRPRVVDLGEREARARGLVELLALARRCDEGTVDAEGCERGLATPLGSGWAWEDVTPSATRRRTRLASLRRAADELALASAR